MLKICEKVPASGLPYIELLEKYYPGKRILFCDIETTGFTPDRAITYLIGLNYRLPDGDWEICQLFNDDGQSEPALFSALYEMLPAFDTLMTFNGDRFDIPFLDGRREKLTAAGLLRPLPPLSRMPSVDLYKLAKPMKRALGLPNVKQKTVERYLGINRVDQMDGGQLIHVYWDYVMTGRTRDKELVLRHNRDDMEGMLLLSGIFGIRQLFSPEKLGGVSVTEAGASNASTECRDDSGIPSGEQPRLKFHIKASFSLPVPHPIDAVGRTGSVSAEGCAMKLSVPIRVGSLNYYFGDKAAGCERREGYFIPLPCLKKAGSDSLQASGSPGNTSDKLKPAAAKRLAVYKESFSSRQAYIPLSDDFLGNEAAILAYAGMFAEEALG